MNIKKKLAHARMDIGTHDPALLMLLAQYPIVVTPGETKGNMIVGFEGFSTYDRKIVLNGLMLKNRDIDDISALLVHELLHILLGHFDTAVAGKVEEISGIKDKQIAHAFQNVVFDIVVNYYVQKYYKIRGITGEMLGLRVDGLNYKDIAVELRDTLKDCYLLNLNNEDEREKFLKLITSENVFCVGVGFVENMIVVDAEVFAVLEWPKMTVIYPYKPAACPCDGIGKSAREQIKSLREAGRQGGVMKDLFDRGVFDIDQKWDLVNLIRHLVGMNSLKFKRKLRFNREDRRGFIKKSKKLQLSVFVAIDTSLSISDEEVKYFIEMVKPLKNRCLLDIVFFSDDIWLRINNRERLPEKFEIKSGGTQYAPVFKAAKDEQYDIKIMATDGYPWDEDSLEMIRGDRKWVFALSDLNNKELFKGFKVYEITGLIE